MAAKNAISAFNDLFDKYFRVKVLYLHSRSVESMRKFGTRISGVASIDRNLDKQEVITEMSINTMFEKYRTGVTIRVIRYEDTAEIYKIIHSHLVAWAEHIANGINIGNAPLKDLIELDQFAAIVYDKAKSVFNYDKTTNALPANFTETQMINFRNILKRETNASISATRPDGTEVTKINKNENDGLPERQSMKQIFSDQVNLMAKWRTGP